MKPAPSLHPRGTLRSAEGKPRRGRPGFTITELLIALFLASVGMVAVFGIQVAANAVQRHARDINAARALGESFLTQLRGEAINWRVAPMSWAEPDLMIDCSEAEMPLCHRALRSAAGGFDTWVSATSRAGNPTRFNALGFPEDTNDARIVDEAARRRLNTHNQRYCIVYNLAPVANVVAPGELLRAQVRVYWPLRDDAFAPPAGVPNCDFGTATLAGVYTGDGGPWEGVVTAGLFRYIQLNSVIYRHEDAL